MSTDAKRKLSSNADALSRLEAAEAELETAKKFHDVAVAERNLAWTKGDRLETEIAELRKQIEAWKKVAFSADSVKMAMRRELDEEIEQLRAKVAELEAETARLRDMAAVAFCADRSLIPAMRNALPGLLDRIDALEAENAKLRAAISNPPRN